MNINFIFRIICQLTFKEITSVNYTSIIHSAFLNVKLYEQMLSTYTLGIHVFFLQELSENEHKNLIYQRAICFLNFMNQSKGNVLNQYFLTFLRGLGSRLNVVIVTRRGLNWVEKRCTKQ